VAPAIITLKTKPALAHLGSAPRLRGNNGVGNGNDPQPPGNPPVNDGVGTSPGGPGNNRGNGGNGNNGFNGNNGNNGGNNNRRRG
jgi:hypothetical protein